MIVKTGGQNAWPPLHRNAPYLDGCVPAETPADPAQSIYYYGFGFLWAKGRALTAAGQPVTPLDGFLPFGQIAGEEYDEWNAFAEENYDDEEDGAGFFTRMMAYITSGIVQDYEMDGAPARIVPTILVGVIANDEDEEDGKGLWLIGPAFWPASFEAVVTLSDETTRTLTFEVSQNDLPLGAVSMLHDVDEGVIVTSVDLSSVPGGVEQRPQFVGPMSLYFDEDDEG